MGGESNRLRDIRGYALVDAPPEPNYDRIAQLAATILDKPVSALSLADADRHPIKSLYGIEAAQITRPMPFCHHTMAGDAVFVVPDARSDVRFQGAPLVAEPPNFRFYAGAPLITSSGSRIGSLYVLDFAPAADFCATKRDILANLAHVAVELLEARSRQIELARCAADLTHIACHDPLTGLGNRRLLDQLMRDSVAGIGEEEQIVVHCLDLDGFKAVNDSLGHRAGDLLLRQVAERLRASLQPADNLVRIGGDEFAIIQKGWDAEKRAAHLAERVIETMARPFKVDGHRINIGVSIGIAVGEHPLLHVEQVLKNADQALYRAKAEGRGRYVFSRVALDGPDAPWSGEPLGWPGMFAHAPITGAAPGSRRAGQASAAPEPNVIADSAAA